VVNPPIASTLKKRCVIASAVWEPSSMSTPSMYILSPFLEYHSLPLALEARKTKSQIQSIRRYCETLSQRINFFFTISPFLIPNSQPPLLTILVGSFICTFFAPERQTIFVPAYFVKVTLGLPPLAPSTSFLFHPVNNSMTLLISIIFFQALPLFLVTLSYICPPTVFAPIAQSVFVPTILAKLNFVFPLFAFGTAFLLHAINGPMALLIYEVFYHRPSISPVIISALILTLALFAQIPQPIFVITMLTKLTLVFPLFAFGAELHLHFSVYVCVFCLLFFRPNLCILICVGRTVLPIRSAICCAVLFGYSFLSRFSSLFDQTACDFLSPNLCALVATAWTVSPSWFAMSRRLLSGYIFISRAF